MKAQHLGYRLPKIYNYGTCRLSEIEYNVQAPNQSEAESALERSNFLKKS